MNFLFRRVYRLRIGKQGSANGRIIEDLGDGRPALRLTFEITKTTSAAPNTSEIKVYNLAPQTRALLEKPDTVCELYAGYGEAAGLVLMHSGNVTFGFSQREGADWVTTFQLADGYVALRDTMLSMALKQGGKASDAIKQIASRLSLPLDMGSEVLDRTWKHGLSFQGLAKNALLQVTRATGLEHSVQNGILQVINTGGTTAKQAAFISSSTGLVGYPERLRQGSQMAASVVDQETPSTAKDVKYLVGQRLRFNGWRIKSLLMPSLNAGDPLVLQSATVKGTFRVETVRHRGDSQGSDWISHIDLLAPNDYSVRQAQQSLTAAKRAVSVARAQKKGAQ